jgi:hypothetical protein
VNTGLKSELLEAHRSALARYSYFLLAAAGAAIGLAVNQTLNSKISTTETPLGLAVLSWGASFFFGCLQIEDQGETLRLNFLWLDVLSGQNSIIGHHPEAMKIAADDTLKHFDRLANRAARYGRWLSCPGGRASFSAVCKSKTKAKPYA